MQLERKILTEEVRRAHEPVMVSDIYMYTHTPTYIHTCVHTHAHRCATWKF